MKFTLKSVLKPLFRVYILIVLSVSFLIILPGEIYAAICNCHCGAFWCQDMCPGEPPHWETYCEWDDCAGNFDDCVNCSSCGGGGSGCFTAETKIATPSGEKEIQDIKEGDVVKSFDFAETGEIKEATVTATHKRQVSGYYILKTESGREIKVTGEHPILAVKANKSETLNLKTFLGNVWEIILGLVK